MGSGIFLSMLALVALTAKDQSLLLCSTFKIAVIAWNNPWKTSTSGNNTAYCEMNDSGYFDDPNV
ncbi:hypothetical protein HanXRQr2_Chr13g0605491 [Helianthus annuus]|uniref:Uncharacterized protein n=2 Tax=Helianthus annuus TaxID=4232 RepID=A0A9K3EK75_HELAN|nr:hypothetical protein HanXRQr2_Chr13g0605491 [Helianthus annuus]KAJ0482772.1 hypothetical protein HanIR_Chr13g0657591 [Helianthus annuus]KAJ0850675.1 hypothetical protein HanPSC8_Chr13g0583571 [Helianthus annuus]